MIREYAVDPETLLLGEYFQKHIAPGFGFFQRRIIARYPKDWKKMAHQHIATLKSDSAKHALTTWLADRADSFLMNTRRGAVVTQGQTWIENTLAEHRRNPFGAILTKQPISGCAEAMCAEDVSESNPMWMTKGQRFIGRNAAEIADCVRPLLECSNKIRYVDAYFDGERSQLSILAACLDGCENQIAAGSTTVEIHVANAAVDHVQRQVSRVWFHGCAAPTVVRWRQGYLHNRMILTDLGGFIFGDTLRHDLDRPDQITCLETKEWANWWDRHDALRHPAEVLPG